jgi:predicted transcriptional regulator
VGLSATTVVREKQQQKKITKTAGVNEVDKTPATLEWLFTRNATAKILDFFLIYKEVDHTESQIAQFSNVSFKTAVKDIKRLEELGIIKMTRKVGNAKLYTINKESEVAKQLDGFTSILTNLLIDKELERQEQEEYDH